MLKVRRSCAAALAAVALLLTSSTARAAGFSIFEAGSQATAMGGAFVAQADDPSAMFYNPAGLAFGGDRPTVMIGDTLIFFRSSLDQGYAPYPGLGYTADQKKQIFFPPNFYASMPVGKVHLSLGTWFPFGLSTAWEDPDQFRGRYLAQRVDLRQYSLALQASVQLAPWVAVGIGPELRVGDVKLQRNAAIFNPFNNQPVDAAHVDIVSDGFEKKLGFGVGALFRPVKDLRLGISFHSGVTMNYSGSARFYQIPTGNAQLDAAFAARIPVNSNVPVSTSIPFPSVLIFGAAVDVSDKLTLEADGNFWYWSVFDQTVLTFGTVDGKTPPTTTLVHDWKNSWTVRAGAKYHATPKFDVMAGFVYDQTPQPDEDVSPLLPDANRTGYSVGVGLSLGERTRLEASNLLLFFHDRPTHTNVNEFNALYKTTADLFVINLRTSF